MSLQELLDDGARAMGEQRYDDAVNIYSEACQVANLETGKDDPDLMFLYAKALFENGVVSNDVLGSGVRGEQKEEDEVNEQEEEGNDGFQFTENVALEEEEEEEEEDDEPEQEEKKDEEKEEYDDDDEHEEVEEQDEEKQEAVQSDFEIAWDILELTRVLYEEAYEKEKSRELGGKVVDVYLLQGDISLETEQFDQAVADLERGVQLAEEVFGLDSGRTHEALFKLGLGREVVGDLEGAQRELNKLVGILASDSPLRAEVAGRAHDLAQAVAGRAQEKALLRGLLLGDSHEFAQESAKRPPPTDLNAMVKRKKKKNA